MKKLYFIGAQFETPSTGGEKYNAYMIKYLKKYCDIIPVAYPWRSFFYNLKFDICTAFSLAFDKRKKIVVFDESLHQRMVCSLLFSLFSKKISLVIMLHQLAYLRRTNKLYFKCTKWIDRLLLKYSTVSIAAGFEVKKKAGELVGSLEKIIPVFTTLQGPIKFSNDKDKSLFLFVGSIVPFKGVKYLIDAISILPDHIKDRIKVKLVGGRPDAQFYNDCITLTKKFNLSSIIEFIPFLKFKQLKLIYRKSSVFLFPSLSESMGMALLEGMSAGCIPIVFDISPMNEFVEHERSGFVAKFKNSNDFAMQIEKIYDISDSDLCVIRKNCLKISKRYNRTWEDVGKEFYNVLKQV